MSLASPVHVFWQVVFNWIPAPVMAGLVVNTAIVSMTASRWWQKARTLCFALDTLSLFFITPIEKHSFVIFSGFFLSKSMLFFILKYSSLDFLSTCWYPLSNTVMHTFFKWPCYFDSLWYMSHIMPNGFREKIAAILLAFSNKFSCMKIVVFWVKYHLNLFPMV